MSKIGRYVILSAPFDGCFTNCNKNSYDKKKERDLE